MNRDRFGIAATAAVLVTVALVGGAVRGNSNGFSIFDPDPQPGNAAISSPALADRNGAQVQLRENSPNPAGEPATRPPQVKIVSPGRNALMPRPRFYHIGERATVPLPSRGIKRPKPLAIAIPTPPPSGGGSFFGSYGPIVFGPTIPAKPLRQ